MARTGKQRGGNNLGMQGIKKLKVSGGGAKKPAASTIATGKAKSYSNKSSGAAGGGMGIGRLGGGKYKGS